MARERCSGETELTLTVRVRDALTAEEKKTEVVVANVPYEGRGTATPATYFDPPEFDGEISIEVDAAGLFEMLEEQDDGGLGDDGLVLVSTPEEIHEQAAEMIAELDVEWEPDEPDYD